MRVPGEPRGAEPPAGGEQNPAGAEPTERGGGTDNANGRDGNARDVSKWENDTDATREARIREWLSDENLEWAEGKSLDEILEHFGNELQPIATFPARFLNFLGVNTTDTNLYCGKGYFIDHAVNHHDEEPVEEYLKIQDILNNPTDVKIDTSKERPTLLFIKQYDKYYIEVVSVGNDGTNKIVLHKSFFHRKKMPHKGLPSVAFDESPADEISAISPASKNETAGSSEFSALDDNTSGLSGGKITKPASNKQENGAESSEISEQKGEAEPADMSAWLEKNVKDEERRAALEETIASVDQTPTNVGEDGSLVNDLSGAPIVFYHGTPNDVAKMSDLNPEHKMRGEEEGARFNGTGISFTPDRMVATEYAQDGKKPGTIFSGNITLKKPYFTYGVSNLTQEEADSLSAYLKAHGYDGIINYSSKSAREAGALPQEVVVFDIKSVSPAEKGLDMQSLEEKALKVRGVTHFEATADGLVIGNKRFHTNYTHNEYDGKRNGIKPGETLAMDIWLLNQWRNEHELNKLLAAGKIIEYHRALDMPFRGYEPIHKSMVTKAKDDLAAEQLYGDVIIPYYTERAKRLGYWDAVQASLREMAEKQLNRTRLYLKSEDAQLEENQSYNERKLRNERETAKQLGFDDIVKQYDELLKGDEAKVESQEAEGAERRETDSDVEGLSWGEDVVSHDNYGRETLHRTMYLDGKPIGTYYGKESGNLLRDGREEYAISVPGLETKQDLMLPLLDAEGKDVRDGATGDGARYRLDAGWISFGSKEEAVEFYRRNRETIEKFNESADTEMSHEMRTMAESLVRDKELMKYANGVAFSKPGEEAGDATAMGAELGRRIRERLLEMKPDLSASELMKIGAEFLNEVFSVTNPATKGKDAHPGMVMPFYDALTGREETTLQRKLERLKARGYEPIGEGEFGPIFDQFKGDAKNAIALLKLLESGEVSGALHHNDVGDIDLVWGNEGTGNSDGFGLAKLLKYHPEVLDNIQEILDDMTVTRRSENRVQLESEKYQAAVRLTWDNKNKTWLLTLFEKKNSALDNTTDTAKTPKGNGNDTATPESTVVSAGKGRKKRGVVQVSDGEKDMLRRKWESMKSKMPEGTVFIVEHNGRYYAFGDDATRVNAALTGKGDEARTDFISLDEKQYNDALEVLDLKGFSVASYSAKDIKEAEQPASELPAKLQPIVRCIMELKDEMDRWDEIYNTAKPNSKEADEAYEKSSDLYNKASEFIKSLSTLSLEELNKVCDALGGEDIPFEMDFDELFRKKEREKRELENLENARVAVQKAMEADLPKVKAGKPKLNIYNYTDKSATRPALGCVYHDKGYAVASDTHIVVASKEDYDAEHEGQLVTKEGVVLDTKFPNWRSVLNPDPKAMENPMPFDCDALLGFIASVEAKLKADKMKPKEIADTWQLVRLSNGDIIQAKLSTLKQFAIAAKQFGAKEVARNGKNMIYASTEKGSVGMTCNPVDEYGYYDYDKVGKITYGFDMGDKYQRGRVKEHKATDEAGEVTTEEKALVDGLVGLLNDVAGIEVIADAEVGQRVADNLPADSDVKMEAKKRALETVSVTSSEEHPQTVVSSADGAKVLNNLDNLTKKIEETTHPTTKTFIGDVAEALGAQRKGSGSQYVTFEAVNGKVVTIRLSNHNAKVSNFDRNGEAEGISIVVSPKKNAGAINDGDAHVVEYYYNAIELRRATGKPLAEIVRSIKQALYSGEFKDTTGLAEVQEINANEKARFFRTSKGEVYGFTIGGKIYIDPSIATAETPIHEYAHLWAEALRNGNPKEWRNVVELMKGCKELWEKVKKDYPELKTDDEIAEEVMSHFSGRQGAERLRQEQRRMMDKANGVFEKAEVASLFGRVKDALGRFWRKVADMLHIHFTSAEEVADRVLYDLLRGFNPKDVAKTGSEGVRYQKAEESDIVKRAKADGTYMKAPNGKPSKLNERQWEQVRSKEFKNWFGDWEKAARIKKLRKSQPVRITGKEIEITDDYQQNKRRALEYGKRLQGYYTNADTGVIVQLQRGRKNGGINELLQHNYKDVAHIQSVAAIPQIIEKSIYIASEANHDLSTNPNVREYQHFVCGLKIGGEDYTVHSLIAVDKYGNRYYDHNLTHIEKTKLLDQINSQAVYGQGFGTTPGTTPTTLNGYKGRKLFTLLQNNSSQVVDENGEPRIVYHGTKRQFWAFDGGKTKGVFDDGLNYFSLDRDFSERWINRDDERQRSPEDNAKLEEARQLSMQHKRETIKPLIEKYGSSRYYETPEYRELEKEWEQWERDNLGLDGMTLKEAKYDYGKRLLECYISAKNIYNPKEKYETEGRQMLIDLGIINPNETGREKAMTDLYASNGSYLYYERKAVVDELERRGYDGILIYYCPLKLEGGSIVSLEHC